VFANSQSHDGHGATAYSYQPLSRVLMHGLILHKKTIFAVWARWTRTEIKWNKTLHKHDWILRPCFGVDNHRKHSKAIESYQNLSKASWLVTCTYRTNSLLSIAFIAHERLLTSISDRAFEMMQQTSKNKVLTVTRVFRLET